MIDIGDRHFPLSELEDHPERFPDVVLMNPDIIKAMLPEYEQLRNAGDLYAASGVHEESSAIGKVVAEMAQRQGYNVVIDTTGSSSSFVGKLEQAVKDGYEVKVRMVSIPTNEAVVRAMARGDRSGRYVAIDPLKGAHRGASGQLAIWKDMPNLDWQLFDNTDGRVLVAEKKAAGEIVIHDQAKLDQILAKANETSTVPSAAVERITAAEPATGPASEALVQPVTLGRAAGGPEARDALAAIDKVHTLPPLRTEPVPVTSNPELRAENGARLVSHSEGAVGVIPDRIEINPMGTHIELDVAHEVGHEIDYSLLQQDRGAVIEAAHTTDAWKNLEKIDTTHGEYLRRDREVFARAYAQWIAERSGNEAMLRALDNYAEDAKFGVANQQWTREDFAPVAAEFDKLFGDRGLLLVTPPAAPVTTAEAASAKLATATAAEPTVTPSLVGIAEQTGGRMEGLDFRVKGQASMERKISADVAEAAQDGVTMTPEEAAARINDALRYTMVFPDANYTEGVTQALAKLKENGFEQIKLKNFWGNPDYQGINGVFEKNGQRIELQFHTPMSFKVKEGQLHPLFEKYRVSTDPSESGKLWVAMEKASASVPQPVGVQSLGTLERHAPPSGLPVTEPALVADTRTVAEIVPGPDAETLAHVQSYQQTRLDGFAANYPVGQFGNSVNEIRDGYRAAVDQKIADLTAAADVQIRVTPHILDKIVDDGRFKSQFEVEHSGGAFNRTLRSQAEQTMFGYSRDLPVEERPIYGYLSGSTSEDGSISQYGPIIIRLTDAAANRATFTLTDSLGAGERRELAPVALADGQAAGKTDAFSTYTTKDPLKATSLAEISDVYAEAQVHGGVTLADIAEVILPKEEIAYRLEGLNRDIGLLEDRVAREQRFIDIHGEAAAQVSARQSIERLSARLADYQAQAALLVDDAAPLRAKLAAAGIKATLS